MSGYTCLKVRPHYIVLQKAGESTNYLVIDDSGGRTSIGPNIWNYRKINWISITKDYRSKNMTPQKVNPSEQPFSKITTPELQARSAATLEKSFLDDLIELENIFKDDTLDEAAKEDKARQYWCDIVSAMAIMEPHQFIAMIERMGIEITADGGIDDPKKVIVDILTNIREINTPKNMAEKVFYIEA